MQVPFKLYGHIYPFDIKSEKLYSYFSSIEYTPIKDHAIKLNVLSEIICRKAKADDIIMLLDGDAFPCDYIDYDFLKIVDSYTFGAIKQVECFEEPIPHPSFFIARVDSYLKHKFDWAPGPRWETPRGEFTDVGARIWEYALKNKLNWYPFNRTNRHNVHPLWFGVYDYRIYHHGAGFRKPISKIDRLNLSKQFGKCLWLIKYIDLLQQRLSIENVYRLQNLTGIQWLLIRKNRKLSENFFRQISDDDSLQIIKKILL